MKREKYKKFTQEDYDEIINYKKEGLTNKEIGDKFQVKEDKIWKISKKILNLEGRFKWTKEKDSKLKELVKSGKSYKEIDEIFNICKGHSSKRARKLGFFSKISLNRIEQENLKKQNLKKCRDCKKIFPRNLDNFYILRSSYCRSCDNLRTINHHQDRTPIQIMQRRAKSIENRCSKKNISYNINAEYLLSLWERQRGICFYSGEKMELTRPPYSKDKGRVFSVDRIEPKKGYVKENIVLCTYLVNVMKLDSCQENFIKICRQITEFQKN